MSYLCTNPSNCFLRASKIEYLHHTFYNKHILRECTHLDTRIRVIICFDVYVKLIHEWTGCACFCVWVCIPCLFLYSQRRFWQKCFDPSRDMATDVIDFLSILSAATWTIGIRHILKYFNSTAAASAFVSTFFLRRKAKKS